MNKKDDNKISNFNEGYAKYNQTAINGSLDKYLKIFVTKHANLISTANKKVKNRMRELGLIDAQDNIVIDPNKQKTPELSPDDIRKLVAVKESKKSSKNKSKDEDQKGDVKVSIRKQNKLKPTPLFKVDAKTFDDFAKMHKTKTNKTGLSVVKQIPTDLLTAVRYTLGANYANLTNQETVILALLVFVKDWHAITNDVQKLIQDSDPNLWESAKLIRQKRQQSANGETKLVKKNVDELYHLNKQLLLMLAYYISLSRWGFDNDNVNDVQDIDKLKFDTNSVRELLNATKDSSDKMIREERNRKGSNMA